MSNSNFDRDDLHDDQADRLSGRQSDRRSQEIRRTTVKAPMTSSSKPSSSQHSSRSSSLAEDRVFGRRAGFIGFSILAHLALLAGIMMNSNLIPALKEIGGGDGQVQGAGSTEGNNSEISIVEVSDTGAPLSPPTNVSSPTNAGLMTDDSSEVALAKEAAAVKAKPVQKPAPQKVAPIVATEPATEPAKEPQVDPSPTQSEETVVATAVPDAQPQPEPEVTERKATPVAAAAINTPDESPAKTSEEADQETSQQETPPTLLATPPGEAETEQASAEEARPENVAAAPAAAAEAAAADSEAGRGGSSHSEQPSGEGNRGTGSGAGLVINGPIRDAGELRALPGNPNPVYPTRDRLKRKEGTAVILGQVQTDGRVGRVVLERSSGSKEMDLESAKAFKRWKFQAGQAGWVRKPFQFRLVGNAKEVPAQLGEVLKRQSGALGK